MKITDEMVAAFKTAFHDETRQAETYDESVRTALSAALGAQDSLNIPDNWLPTSENINALPRPLRDFIMRLHASTDPAGELRRAMVAEMERDALRKMIEEAPEVQFYECFNPEDFALASEIIDVFDASLAGKRAKILEVE